MTRLPQPSNPLIIPNESMPTPPQVTLIDDSQWEFLKNRYRMTQREVEIAQSICRGLNNEAIADSLNITQGTVKTHIRNIYRKTWVRNKICMLLRFIEDTRTAHSA